MLLIYSLNILLSIPDSSTIPFPMITLNFSSTSTKPITPSSISPTIVYFYSIFLFILSEMQNAAFEKKKSWLGLGKIDPTYISFNIARNLLYMFLKKVNKLFFFHDLKLFPIASWIISIQVMSGHKSGI